MTSSLQILMLLIGGAIVLLMSVLWVRARAAQQALQVRLSQLEQHTTDLRTRLEHCDAARASAEADLRGSEQRYLLALRGSQDGLWEWNLDSGAVQLSPRWKSMLGFEAHELADDKPSWRARVHADDRAGLEQALQRHLDGVDAQFDHPLRLLHKDGTTRHLLSRGMAIRRESGVAYRMIGLDTDVTALRRVQAILEAVADGTSQVGGRPFFAALVEHFARALEVDCALVTECADDPPTRVRTLGYWSARDGPQKNFEFELAGTPCEEVVQQGRTCLHREGLEQKFPAEAGFESYLGMPIVSSDGRVLGHLAFLDTRPRGDDLLMERVYRIFVSRAAAEIERLQALARLRPAPGLSAAHAG